MHRAALRRHAVNQASIGVQQPAPARRLQLTPDGMRAARELDVRRAFAQRQPRDATLTMRRPVRVRRRFPQFRWRGDERGCFEPGGGFVQPEACIAAQLEEALRHGARAQIGERVLDWSAGGDGVTVSTDRATYSASRLILTAGAWLPGLVPALATQARVYRQTMFWFPPDGDATQFSAQHMPVYVRLGDEQTPTFYGFPIVGGPGAGLKLAGEQFEHATSPDAIEPEVSTAEREAMYARAAPHLRIAAGCLRAVACKYTVTPDFDFVIDHVPESDRVWVASACSGHGFKHSAAVGEALAELAVEGRTQFDLSPFALARWFSAEPPA